jgi:chromosome segregation ATPase
LRGEWHLSLSPSSHAHIMSSSVASDTMTSLEASGSATRMHGSDSTHELLTHATGSPGLGSSGNYVGHEASYERGSPGGRLRPIPKDRLKYQKYVYGEQQQHEVDDGLNSSQLSFEDASRLHSSAIAMETATIQNLRKEKWHLTCELDELKRALDAERADKQTLTAKVDGLQSQYEGKLRLLRDSTEGDIRKESLRTKELEIALHHKDAQLKDALLMRSDKENKDVEVWRQKAEHYERELQERVVELESVRALHRKSEQRLMLLETSGAEKAAEWSTLAQKLQDTEEQLRVVRRELDERRTGAESLRAHSDSIALQVQIKISNLGGKEETRNVHGVRMGVSIS